MSKTNYRSTNRIIQSILEAVLRSDRENPYEEKGIIKSHIIKLCSLKTTTAEKYLSKMVNAGYISSNDESWGDRTITIYKITDKGKERYNWFVMINSEMDD